MCFTHAVRLAVFAKLNKAYNRKWFEYIYRTAEKAK